METKQKTAYFEWLRLFASAAVVLMHTAAMDWYGQDCTSTSWRTLTVFDSLVRWPVPVFVMITGALFLPRKTPWRTILTRYIPRMLAAFTIWSGVHALYQLWADPAADGWLIFAQGKYHLWYLPYLCGVYLTLPFLQKIAEDNRLTGQLAAAGLILGSLIPWGLELAELLLPRQAAVLAAVRGHLNYAFFLDLLGPLVLGHRLHSHELPRRHRRVLYGLGLVCAGVTVAATIHFSRRSGAPVSLFFQHASPLNLCTAAAIFVFAKNHLTTLPAWVARTAKCSFGVYLSHALVIDLLADRGIHALAWDPVWSVPVLSAAVFAISLALTAVLKRVPLLGNYLA